MKMSAKQFRDWPNKVITMVGMSGVGKTTFSSLLPSNSWFHYSGDYRIGTRYLDESILDHVKKRAMEHDYLAELLRRNLICIKNNITIDHLQPISEFLGKIGSPNLGGLSVDEFKRRQALFRDAEVKAMADVSSFIDRSRQTLNIPHFINDAGGSICGLSDEECWNKLSDISVVLYLRASEEMEKVLLERAKRKPKPLFYENGFLDRHLTLYCEHHDLQGPEEIFPDEFVQWVFPKLVAYRKPQYERVAEKFGYTIEADVIPRLRDESDIIDLVCDTMAQFEH